MKLNNPLHSGFTLAEVLMATAIFGAGSALVIATTVSLQKSFKAVDAYFSSHMQQVRIVDYIARDVHRAYSVITSADLQTVTMTIPDYIDSATGLPRTPTIVQTATGKQVNYGATTSTVVYALQGTSITRTENGVLTSIASSTDQLVPLTTDTEVNLANTEYTRTSVTFQPLFRSNGGSQSRAGTTVLSLSYLRNLRRG